MKGNELPYLDVCEKLRSRRKALGYTQEGLAKAVGVRKETIKYWETGQVDIRYAKFCNYVSLCEVLRCDLTYLITDQELPTLKATDVQEVTHLSGAAVESLLDMASGNQWFSLRALDALLRYSQGAILDNIGFYLHESETMEAPNGMRIPKSAIYSNIVTGELAVLRSRIQEGDYKWPEDTVPLGDDAYIWVGGEP